VIQYLTSTSTVRLIEQIVLDAEENLVLVTASPRFSGKLMQQLKSADDRGVSTQLMVDDVLFQEAVAEQFASFKNVDIFRCRDLNGHCYASERTMVVTSMGLSDTVPTGVHVGASISSDEQAYSDAMLALAELRDSVNMLDTVVEEKSARKKNTAAKNDERSPLLRVIRGGLRKKFNREKGEDSSSEVTESCAVCGDTVDDFNTRSLCPDCEQRKTYQHTALYLANDVPG
jgi:hypothetical protein